MTHLAVSVIDMLKLKRSGTKNIPQQAHYDVQIRHLQRLIEEADKANGEEIGALLTSEKVLVA